MVRKMRIVKVPGFAVPDWDVCDQDIMRYLPDGQVVEVRARAEFFKDVRSGACLPADEASAKLCGVRFDKAAVEKLLPIAKGK